MNRLSDKQIIEVEAVYIARNCYGINYELFVNFIIYFKNVNIYQYIYLKWLCERWTWIRRDNRHMPTRY
jgi:hypothetical protein